MDFNEVEKILSTIPDDLEGEERKNKVLELMHEIMFKDQEEEQARIDALTEKDLLINLLGIVKDMQEKFEILSDNLDCMFDKVNAIENEISGVQENLSEIKGNIKPLSNNE